MPKILALWAIPRSTSTAFEWMMRQRGDFKCLHEPFGEAWYQGENPLWPRYKNGEKTTSGLTIKTVWETLSTQAKNEPVFIKDFPHYINHFWNPEFLSCFNHAFLIRDPAKTITSIYSKWPDFDELEVGFPEQRALFDLLTAINKQPPPVIDSDDLLEDPHGITEAFCNAVGIPFIENALTWEIGGVPSNYSWWDGGSFHTSLAQSTGLARQPRAYIDLNQAPERVRQVHRRMLPHYQHLYAHRLQPATAPLSAR